VSNASEHLAMAASFFGLDELFLETLEVSDIAAGKNHAVDFVVFIKERAEVKQDAAPFAMFVANRNSNEPRVWRP